jgi:hypothetical protein
MSSTATANKRPVVTVLGIAPTEKSADVFVLASFADEPFDAEQVTSVVYRVRMDGLYFQGIEELLTVPEWLTCLTSVPFGEAARPVAAGMDGRIHYLAADGSWRASTLPNAANITSLHIRTQRQDVLALTMNGDIARLHDGQLTTVRPTEQWLWDASTGGDATYVVGAEGTVLRDQGGQWTREDVPTNATLMSVLVVSPNEIYIGGGGGVLFHGDGRYWKSIEGPEHDWSALCHFQGQVYAASARGVYKINGDSVELFKKLSLTRLFAHSDRMMACGDDVFAWFDGQQWAGGPFFGR